VNNGTVVKYIWLQGQVERLREKGMVADALEVVDKQLHEKPKETKHRTIPDLPGRTGSIRTFSAIPGGPRSKRKGWNICL